MSFFGADPGIDHTSAMKIIDNIKQNAGNILSFKSYCGGLPAPDAKINPFGYKFSWSPKGVVLAGRNSGIWKDNGNIRRIQQGNLFKEENLEILNVEKDNLGSFEVYANRDSLKYINLYGLTDIKTMFRGTLRNSGWCRTWDKITELGYLEIEEIENISNMSYEQFLRKLTGLSGTDIEPGEIITGRVINHLRISNS